MASFAPVTLGRVSATQTLGALRLTETCHAGGTALQLHDHEDYTVNVVMAGTVEERVGRRTYECGPGSLLAKPPGQHHANRYFGTSVRCIVVQLGAGFAGHEWSSRLAMERVVFRHSDAVLRAALRLSRVIEQPNGPDVELLALAETSRLLSFCGRQDPGAVPASWVAEARSL